jgi:hypothetical protein
MNAAALAARVRRLDELSRGIAREIQLVAKADDPMLYVERQAYLAGMRRLLNGIDSARVVLVKARLRLATSEEGRHGR